MGQQRQQTWKPRSHGQPAISQKTPPEAKVRLDLNNPVFQEHLLTLQHLKRQKPERQAALDILNKIRQLTWNQPYLTLASGGRGSRASKRPMTSTPCIPYASAHDAALRPIAMVTSWAC
ncbi:hypothetical protein [Cyanobium sp. ATX 6F1]|uniref:hypothetical protein n=1 Tax=Cyanobium sp. ATX 6F1 TaxID=2823702 RepID=UPI0020CE201A|nr:hypothetical protein [Cyanobium sp. ATX 6F1]